MDDPFARIQVAMQMLGRRANLPRLHEHFAQRAGVAIDRGAYGTLVRIADRGPMRVTELARSLGVEPSTVTRHVQSLEALGYTSRAPDPSDGRAYLVGATSEGRRVLDRLRAARVAGLGEILGGWDTADVSDLASLLERLVTDLVDFADRL